MVLKHSQHNTSYKMVFSGVMTFTQPSSTAHWRTAFKPSATQAYTNGSEMTTGSVAATITYHKYEILYIMVLKHSLNSSS